MNNWATNKRTNAVVVSSRFKATSKKIDSWGRFDETAEKSKQQFGEIFTIAQYVLLRKIDLPICFTKS